MLTLIVLFNYVKQESKDAIGEALSENRNANVTGRMGQNADDNNEVHPNYSVFQFLNLMNMFYNKFTNILLFYRKLDTLIDLIPEQGIKPT